MMSATFLRFDPNGIHLVEMFAEPGVTMLLPGVMPSEDRPEDAWQDDLVRPTTNAEQR